MAARSPRAKRVTPAPDSMREMLIHHEHEIGLLTQSVGAQSARLAGIETKLDSLISSAAIATAYKPQSWPAILAVVKDGALMLGILAGAIVYVASGHYGPEIAVMKYQIEQVQKSK